MTKIKIISADSHVTEPADLWVNGLDKKYKHRAPKLVLDRSLDSKPALMFTVEGASSMPAAGGFAAGLSGEELAEFMATGDYNDARPSGWDPAERLKDQDFDGISGEVLYPTLGMQVFQMPDAELQRACFHVYNNWLAEYCSYDPNRLYGIGLISLLDVASAIKDVKEISKANMRGLMVWSSPPIGENYGDSKYDLFWAIVNEIGLPVTLHPITGRGAKAVGVSEFGNKKFNHAVLSTNAFHEVQETIAELIFTGVLEKYPDLKIVSAEADVGWFPHFLYRMDHFCEKLGGMQNPKLSFKPSEYAKRQVWGTFQDDIVGVRNSHFFGEDNYMWASDFPHSDSTFPNSVEYVRKNFEGLSEKIKAKITYTNACKLYSIDI